MKTSICAVTDYIANPKQEIKDLNVVKNLIEPFTWDLNDLDRERIGEDQVAGITTALMPESNIWEELEAQLAELKKRYPEVEPNPPGLDKEIAGMDEFIKTDENFKEYLDAGTINMSTQCEDLLKSNVMGNKTVRQEMMNEKAQIQITHVIRWAASLYPAYSATMR